MICVIHCRGVLALDVKKSHRAILAEEMCADKRALKRVDAAYKQQKLTEENTSHTSTPPSYLSVNWESLVMEQKS